MKMYGFSYLHIAHEQTYIPPVHKGLTMFWNKNKKDLNDNAKPARSEVRRCQSLDANIELRRAVLDWRDKHTKNIELHLTREIASLHNALNEQILKMGYKDFLFTSRRFSGEYLEPIYKDWVHREVTHVMDAAQKDLYAVINRAMECPGHSAVMADCKHQGHYVDITIAVSATTAGLATIPAVAAFSATSAAGILGLLGGTVISLPAVLFGTVMSGLLLTLGSYKALGVKSRALSRYQKTVIEETNREVLGYNGNNESIRHRLQLHILSTAENIIMEIDCGNTLQNPE